MKIMAVDYGDARTGLAVCDKTEMLASPVGVIREYNIGKTLQKVADAAKECGAQLIIVGHPLNMNGTAGERAKKVRRLCQKTFLSLWRFRLDCGMNGVPQLLRTNT